MTATRIAHYNWKKLGIKWFAITTPIVVVLSFSYGGTVSAHVLAQDNGVSSVLHIPPYDHPKANEQTKLQLQFSNTDSTSGSFELSDYSITYSITDNNKPLFHGAIASLYPGDASASEVAVNFPHIGIYDMKIQGRPVGSGKSSFAIDYTLRVSTSAPVTKKASTNNTPLLFGVGTIIIVIFGLLIVQELKPHSNAKKK